MTWFVAAIVMIDMLSTSLQERYSEGKRLAGVNTVEEEPVRMPAFCREDYFADRDAMVTLKVKEFPESAGWRKLNTPVRSSRF